LAAHALEHYLKLAGESGRRDAEAQRILKRLRKGLERDAVAAEAGQGEAIGRL
jgi:hypothetical protein